MQKHESALTSQRALSQGWFLVYTHPGPVQMVFLNSLNGHVLSFLASLLGMWDLNSLTRDRTLAPCIGKSNLNHWTARKVPCCCSCSVAQSCLTLCEPVDCSPPGSSVHGISQARILEWVAISSCRGSSRPRDPTHVSCTGRRIPYHWAIREAQESPGHVLLQGFWSACVGVPGGRGSSSWSWGDRASASARQHSARFVLHMEAMETPYNFRAQGEIVTNI